MVREEASRIRFSRWLVVWASKRPIDSLPSLCLKTRDEVQDGHWGGTWTSSRSLHQCKAMSWRACDHQMYKYQLGFYDKTWILLMIKTWPTKSNCFELNPHIHLVNFSQTGHLLSTLMCTHPCLNTKHQVVPIATIAQEKMKATRRIFKTSRNSKLD